MHREFTKKDQDDFAEIVAQYKGTLGSPTVSLEIIDGKLFETGGNWRNNKIEEKPTNSSMRGWLAFMGMGADDEG